MTGKSRKGDYCVVLLGSGHRVAGIHTWVVRRVLRTRADGFITHVCTENLWRLDPPPKATTYTSLKGQTVVRVYRLGASGYARRDLSALANGDRYGGGFDTEDMMKAAILGALA